MKCPQKTNNTIQTEVRKPAQELMARDVSSKALQAHSNKESNLEITVLKKSNSSQAGIYWIVFFVISAISAITYTVVTSKPIEPQVVKREVHKIYEKIEIHNRSPAATKASSADNYFEKSEARNKIYQRYSILKQNLYNEKSNLQQEGRRKDLNFYNSQAYLDLDSEFDKKHLMLRGEKAAELCEKINEDCDRAQEFMAFKKNNPGL
jgi:hypothetical protein